jgi:signal transduction histidine kinase
MERMIARCRVLLSVVALVAIYLDPTTPTALPGLELRGGSLHIDPRALAVLLAHLLFSGAVYTALVRGVVVDETIGSIATWADLVFAGAIAAVTEGVSSPFYAFFVFAVMTAGFRMGPRRVAVFIVVAVAMYLSLMLVSRGDDVENFYVMRPVYLAVVGYLIAYLAQQRTNLEGAVRRLEAGAERSRIASNLHDGSLQTLVAVRLRLEGLQALVREGRQDEVLDDLSTLQDEVTREYGGLRSYVRDLARVGQRAPAEGAGDADVSVEARFSGSLRLVDDVLQIAREALTNVRRHSSAQAATISARDEGGRIVVSVDDDGVGFTSGASTPWSIASKVRAAGGELRVEAESPGAHLRIELPRRFDA